jgi:hypothetical protein
MGRLPHGRLVAPSAASLELGQGLFNVVVPLDPEDSPVTDRVNLPTGGPTTAAPLEAPRAWMRARTKTRSPCSRTSSTSTVAARPAPSKKFSKAVRIPARPLRVPPSIASSGLTNSMSGCISSSRSVIAASTDSLRLITSYARRTVSSPDPAIELGSPPLRHANSFLGLPATLDKSRCARCDRRETSTRNTGGP